MGEGKVKRSAETIEEIDFDVAPPSNDVEAPISTKKIKKSKRSSEAALLPPAPADPAEGATSTDVEAADVPAMSHKEARLAKRRKLSGIDPPAGAVPIQSSSMHPSRVISLAGNTIQGAPGVTVGNTPGKLDSRSILFFWRKRIIAKLTGGVAVTNR